MLTPEQKKQVLELAKEAVKPEELIKSLVEEFGRRCQYAMDNAGLSPEVAFEACKIHYLRSGEAMIKIANEIQMQEIKKDLN